MDVLVLAEGEAFYLSELRVLKLLAQLLEEVFATSVVAFERHT